MQGRHGSWRQSAAISGFRVRPSRALRLWRAGLIGLWAVALLAAPLAVLGATAVLLSLRGCRGRLACLPVAVDGVWFAVDTATGFGQRRTADGSEYHWRLCRWFRCPWLIVLRLREEGGGRRHACLVLPRDTLDDAAWRRLYWLLGTSTLGSAAGSRSG